MSVIKLLANTSGTGTLTVSAPNTNTDRTITIPADTSGNVVISDGSLITASYNASRVTFTGTVDLTGANTTGLGSWTIQNANNVTLTAGQKLYANTRAGALTLTLPAAASIGDSITVVDSEGLASSNNITIERNNHYIDGVARSVILNVDRQGVDLIYVSPTTGWSTRKQNRETLSSGAQGEVSGYSSGGDINPGRVNIIDKFSFTSDGNATDIGDITQSVQEMSGQSSNENGYRSGGNISPGGGVTNVIDKFPFAIDTDATDIGDLTQARSQSAGQSSLIHGYATGGDKGVAPPEVVTVDKFPFAIDTNATDVGDLTQARRAAMSGQSSQVDGYTSGGFDGSTASDRIDKFPFASDSNATDIGNLISGNYSNAGQSSLTHGYVSGGEPPITDQIQKFPFASNFTTASDVGNLTVSRKHLTGVSSTLSGYSMGGIDPGSPGNSDVIDKFPFASDSNATDVGNLSATRRFMAGQQV